MISVIIPTYNRSKTIINSVTSVLNQSYSDIELIIVDDASTDDTLKKLSQIDSDKMRIYSLDQNKGANYARNYGVLKAKGKFIAFQDSDDIWYEEKLERQISILNGLGVDVVGCNMISIDEMGKTKKIYEGSSKFVDFEELLYENFISTQTILCKRELLLENIFLECIPRFQDWEWLLRISKSNKIYVLKEVLVEQHIQSDSITKNPQKALISLEYIMECYGKHIDTSREIKGNLYYYKGIFEAKANLPHIKSFFISLKNKFTVKAFLRFIASLFRFY